MASKTAIKDPLINEAFFDIMYASTPKEKAKLNARQLRMTKTDKATKNFAVRSTLDEKLIMLAKLGVGYALIIGKSHLISPKNLKALYNKHKDKLSEETVTDIIDSGLVVTTDRHITTFYNMLGNICHSDTYMLNRDFHKAGHHISNWKDVPHATNEELLETQENVNLINKMFLNLSMGLKEVKGFTEIGDLDLNILMFLFGKKNFYVARGSIDLYFRSAYKMTIITAAVKRLLDGAHIERAPSNNENKYLITSLGIDVVMSFQKRILNETMSY